ncbi:hypothetical protein ACTFIW_000043 [Dictyostelium discoideum]
MKRLSLHIGVNASMGADFTCYPAATQNERALHLKQLPLVKNLDYLENNLFSTYKSKTPRSTSISYPVDAIDVKNPTSYYAVSWITTHISNQLECLALAILDSVIMDIDASPL